MRVRALWKENGKGTGRLGLTARLKRQRRRCVDHEAASDTSPGEATPPQSTKVASARERQLFLPIPGPLPSPPQAQAEEQPCLHPGPTPSCPSIFPEGKAPLWPAGTPCPAPRRAPPSPHAAVLGANPPSTMLRGCAPLAPLQTKLHSTYLYSSQRQLTRFGAVSEHPHWQFSQRPVFKQRQTCLDLLRRAAGDGLSLFS